jgi:hypothetical protein
MLNVGLTVSAGGCKIRRVALGDEGDDVCGQLSGKPSRRGLARN